MEIKASQRRGPARSPRPLHQKLARRRAWQQRLVCGGALALLTSLGAWLAGASLPLHLGLVALAFFAGLGWRFAATRRRAERWAFGWIEARSGLAYLSAFELPETATDGLSSAVRARAAKTGSLDTPPLQPWALPLLVSALTLALAPHLALPALRAPLAPLETTQPGTPPTPGETTLESDATTRDAATTDAASPPVAGTPADPDPDKPDADAERSFDTAAGADQNLGAGEQAALNRFLEQTEAAEVSPMETRRGPSQSAAPTGRTQRSGVQGEREAGEEGDAAQSPGTTASDATPGAEPGETAQGAATGEGRATEPESSSQDAATERERGQQSGASGLSDTQEEDASAQEPETPTEQPSTVESQRAESASAESDRQSESLTRAGEPTVQRGATPDESSQATQDIKDGGSSERGGTRAGAEVESSRERLGGPDRAPERITGIRGNGPTTTGGEALQQGQAPDTLPQTGNPGSYRRAAEEVIREGRIPLEYQEIVRNYFR